LVLVQVLKPVDEARDGLVIAFEGYRAAFRGEDRPFPARSVRGQREIPALVSRHAPPHPRAETVARRVRMVG
jgi:hypothetical protein